MHTIINIKDLHKTFDKATILNNLNVEVKRGDVIALLGKNGAGKTTLLEIVLGYIYPTRGTSQLWNTNAVDIEGDIKQRIGFVPQLDELLPSVTGEEHLRLYKEFRNNWNQELVDRLVVEWDIPVKMKVAKLSVGQRQKLSILLAIAHDPELLILDEPVASLDPIARRQFLQQLVDMASDENRAIIFSTHIVSDVERVANKVWMLRGGDLVYQDELDQLKEQVARITISCTHDNLALLDLPSAMNIKISGRQAVATFLRWDDSGTRALEQRLNAEIFVERLSLEDIFLELNQ